ncbi:MAG TPA: type II toxin-antitoxin system RelE/ParE family toxin [Woeseiaceae bacterium]|nr:type II toxin-antitoxin system RelE/ParE family toxin [Woeseiaceae bacterium]
MASYRLRVKKSAIKDLEAIPTRADRRRIVKRVESLADNPRPKGVQKLSGKDRYRIRQGRYRILYSIRDRELIVYIVRVGDRKSVYRNP